MHHARFAPTAALAVTLSLAGGASARPDAGPLPDPDRHSVVHLTDEAPARTFERDGRILSVYGRHLSRGDTPEDSTASFIEREVEPLFGIAAGNLRPGSEEGDGRPVKGLMFDRAAGRYRHLLHRYTQTEGGIPVFQSELKLMVLNAPGFPVVLANSSLRDLRGFEVAADRLGLVNDAQALAVAVRELGPGAVLLERATPVVYAGVDTHVDAPTLAARFVASEGAPGTVDYQSYLLVVDPVTGAVLFRDSRVLDIDVTGNVSANATDGSSSDRCDPFAVRSLPYARVNVGGTVAYADANGDFVIPNGGGGDVTVESRVWGPWFRAINFGGPDALLSQVVTPPGPANFLHNPDEEEFPTAEVNAYIHCNLMRDKVLDLDPGFPINDPEFAIHVNDTGSCNAFYQGSNLLFLRGQAKGGCPNTAFSSIVYHEYGHHLVARATGSQCQWGEGNSDVASVLMLDEPGLAFGFFGDCSTPLRNADNSCQYDASGCSSCGGPCHNCGQLISGCAWDLRENLVVTEPADYRTILGQLWLASLYLHDTGQEITPADTINYLMADDDDGNIDNGTPHYFEIADAFTLHSMPPPPLQLVEFEFPDGRPEFVVPAGGQPIRVNVASLNADPVPGTGLLHFDNGTGVVEIPMVEMAPNEYEATFPAAPCGVLATYFFSVETDLGFTAYAPLAAPDDRYVAVVANGSTVVLADDFESDLGWTTESTATNGDWERRAPIDCGNGNPSSDGDGSGQCYQTYVREDTCLDDVDNGAVTLTSPVMDASSPDAHIVYWRWYDNSRRQVQRDDAFEIEVSDDGGLTWVGLETVGPLGPEAEGGWYLRSFRVADFVASTDQFMIRFIASDESPPSHVEAAVDGVILRNVECGAPCPEDLDGDGDVGFSDLLAVLNAWGQVGGPEDLDGNGTVGFGDLLAVLSAWGPCL